MIELFWERYGGVCEVTRRWSYTVATLQERSAQIRVFFFLPKTEWLSKNNGQFTWYSLFNNRFSFYWPMLPFCDRRNYRDLNTSAFCCTSLSFKCTDQTTHNPTIEARTCDGNNFVRRSIQRGIWKGSLTESPVLKVAQRESVHWDAFLEGECIQRELQSKCPALCPTLYSELGHSKSAAARGSPIEAEACTEVAGRLSFLLWSKFQL